MDPLKLIDTFYPSESAARTILVAHSRAVAGKAVAVAQRVPELHPDITFIREAAWLHDIGIFLTDAPGIGCNGEHPYICHGYLGADLLYEAGLIRHAKACERHTGVGLTRQEIRGQGLPLPDREMVPHSIEEQIVCYADKFFSKNPGDEDTEKPPAQILAGLSKFGSAQADRFRHWLQLFREEESGLRH